MKNKRISRRTVLLSGVAGALAAKAESPTPLKVGFIGTGHRGAGLIRVMKQVPGFEIVALADPTPEFLDRAATIAGKQAATYSDYKKMLAERKDLQAVAVVTPGALHVEPTVAALERGLHVMCEKPMATTIEGANRMIAAAQKAGKILQIDHQMRFRRDYAKLKELVKSGEIGDVQFINAYLHRGDWNPASWKTPHPKTGVPTIWRFLNSMTGGSMMEDGIHEIDVLNWIVDARLDRVYSAGGNNILKNRETIDHAGVTVEYQNGVKLQFGFTLLAGATGVRDEPMFIVGSKGSLLAENEKITLRKGGGKPVTIEAAEAGVTGDSNPAMAGQGAANYLQIKSFLDNIRTGRKPLCDGQAGKEAIRIPLLAQKAIEERRVVHAKELPA
jgi:predicted dehydrogenase